jgi:hypothetical protein
MKSKKFILITILLLIFTSISTVPTHAETLNAQCVIGSSSSCPAQSPQEIVNLYGTSTNGSYWLNVNGTARETYLILNSSYPDSGGWFLGMKGTNSGSAFLYNSLQWTDSSTTLTTTSLSDNVSTEAKFHAFNELPVIKLVAVFKDRASQAFNTNGSGDLGTNLFGGHTWMETVTSTTMFSRFTTNNNIVDGAGYTGRYTIHRETNSSSGKLVFPYQTGWTRYGFNNTVGYSYRWGTTSNNEGNMGSNDSVSGIGLAANSASAIVSYSDNLTVGPNGSSGVTNPGNLNYPSGFQIWGKMADPNLLSPRSLSITPIAGGNVTATWLPPVSGSTSEYLLQYKPASASDWSNATTHRVTSITATPSVTISGMATNTYNFRVFARNSPTNQTSATPVTSGNISVNQTSTFNSFGLSGGATTAVFRKASTINADVSVASKVTFKSSGVVITGCKNKIATGSGSSFTATCSWKPSHRGRVNISAVSTPVDSAISGASAPAFTIVVANRAGTR